MRTYRQVADRIQQIIADDGIAAGERLLPERELSARLQVSRASLREALIALELSGVIEVRSGSGVYVTASPQAAALPDDSAPGPFEVLSARRLIESEVAAIAARMASDSAIAALLRALEELEKQHDNFVHAERLDRNFHLAIANASGNSALAGAVSYLWNQLGPIWHKLKEHYETEALRTETTHDHRRIYSAIAARDPAAARQAMRDHLDRVTRTFSRG
ncbi:FadR/GntR family transcriptional regulator [Pseudoduganella rhizocola]|uniref:FadR/GntR family transcriptional regulator n=1 Tax=Pseudoduganella rhizocola TaxID=3382643 RepID=UPI0038B484F2